MFELINKEAVITGGGSGIGKAVALIFAKQGANVHLLDMSENGLTDTAAAIRELGGRAETHLADVTNQQAVRSVFEKIGRIDILVNCAGISNIGRADNTSE